MRIINHTLISQNSLTPSQCVELVKESFLLKSKSHLPPKVNIRLGGNIRLATMPSLSGDLGRYAMKLAMRYPLKTPASRSYLLLVDSDKREIIALLDGTWISTMRTGAVAALAIMTLKRTKSINNLSIIGLGNSARATLICLLDTLPNQHFKIKLLKYKGQEKLFMERFAGYENLTFSVVDEMEDLIKGSDVVVSCITKADKDLADDSWFNPGVLIVPVHTLGFQNCDLFFDKVFGDDTGHVRDFKHFNRFKFYAEFADVLSGKIPGRESDEERILSYNIGIGLHDLMFANAIVEKVKNLVPDITFEDKLDKFWI